MTMLSMPITVPARCDEDGGVYYPAVGVIDEKTDPVTGQVYYCFKAVLPRGGVARIEFFAPRKAR